jgi:hypothetical protein
MSGWFPITLSKYHVAPCRKRGIDSFKKELVASVFHETGRTYVLCLGENEALNG